MRQELLSFAGKSGKTAEKSGSSTGERARKACEYAGVDCLHEDAAQKFDEEVVDLTLLPVGPHTESWAQSKCFVIPEPAILPNTAEDD